MNIFDRPVAYNHFLKILKAETSLAHLYCAALKLGLHSLGWGPVTKAVTAGTSNFDIQKRVSSVDMVDHYSVADHQFLLKTSKSAL